MKFKLLLFVLLRGVLSLHAQTSSFDTGNENWRASGDPTSFIAFWEPAGGNPGGFIRVVDQAVGGLWYFEAPPLFTGNKCDAYGRYLRWDQFISDTLQQFNPVGTRDVVLESTTLTLVFDLPQNPGLNWTHFDVLLREDAGWRIGNVNGPAPTTAQFRSVLATLSAVRIQGEYRAQADFGGLDNFVLESSFQFDLDGDDSSGEGSGGFRADTSCTAEAFISDTDVLLFSEQAVDSVVLRLPFIQNALLETLNAGTLPSGITAQQTAPGWLTLVNAGGASTADFIAAIRTVEYADLSPNPARAVRIVSVRVFSGCGEMAQRYAYLPIFPAGNAGIDTDTLLCPGEPAIDLFDLLGGSPQGGGIWQPALTSGGNLFVQGADAPGMYQYRIPGAGPCPGDTAEVTIDVEKQAALRNDTTLCFGEVLQVLIPPGVIFWNWSNGSQGTVLEVDSPGVYFITGLTENCPYSDSVRVDFFTCEKCPVYAPNVFKPGSDHVNSRWQIFPGCVWQNFRLEIFDRWGNLLFETADANQAWDGTWKGKPVPPGVYGWYAEWQADLRGKPELYRERGGVTVLR